MNDKLGKFVTDKPLITVIAVLLITFLMMAINAVPEKFSLEKNEEENETNWLPENDVVKANNEINENYGIQKGFLSVIVQGKGGNVLTPEALVDILEVEGQIVESPEVQEVLFPEQGSVLSLSSTLARQMLDNNAASYAEMKGALGSLNKTALDGMLENIMLDPMAAPMVGMFLTKDFKDHFNEEEDGSFTLKAGVDTLKAKGSQIIIQLNSEKYDEIDVEKDHNPILDADNAILKIFKETEFKGVDRMGIIENEYINEQIEEESGGVMGQLLQLVFILIIVILFLTYRSVFDTVVSLLALMFALTWMDGIGVILGLSFTMMYQAVPIMLMGLGIDYAIHLVMRYREERHLYNKTSRDALVLTTVSVGAALFLATVTTAVSFGSNTVSEIRPMKEFAIFALVGIISAFIIMVTFVPASKMLYHDSRVERFFLRGIAGVKNRLMKNSNPGQGEKATQVRNGKKGENNNDNPVTRFLAKGALAAEHHSTPVIAGVVVLSLLCTWASFELTTEFDFTEFLPEGAQISEDIIYATDNFEFGTEEGDILIKGNISDPDVLKAMSETEENILDDPDEHVNEQDPIESILTLMYDIANDGGDIERNATFADMYNDSDSNPKDGVPDRNITELFRFLRKSDAYHNQTISVLHYNNETGEYDGAVIRVGVNSQNGKYNEEISDELDDDIAPLEKVAAIDKVTPTGEPVLVNYVIKSIETSGLQSLAITVVVALIILTFIFRVTDGDWLLGLLTEIPVLLVIAWVFASMWVIGMPLNVMTIMIASLTVGLGITYGIHVTHRFVEDISELDDIDAACRSTVVNTGAALCGAAITTIGGFGVLVLAPIPPMKKFGAISSLSIAFSLIASIFVLPTFLTVWAKWKKKKDPCYFQHHADVKHKIEARALACEVPEEKDEPSDPATTETPEEMRYEKALPTPPATEEKVDEEKKEELPVPEEKEEESRKEPAQGEEQTASPWEPKEKQEEKGAVGSGEPDKPERGPEEKTGDTGGSIEEELKTIRWK